MNTKQKLKFGAVFAAIWVGAASVAYAQDHGHEVQPPPPGQAREVQPRPPGPDHPVTGGKEADDHGSAAPRGSEHGGDAHGTAGAHGAAGHQAHGGGHHGPEPINWTDIWDKKRPAFVALVINIGLLGGLIYFLGKKPIAAGLKQRRITIGKDIEDAQKMLAEAKERAAKYQADLKNVETDAATAKAALIAAGKGESDRVIEEAQERAERMKRDAERLVEQERKQLAVDLRRDTVELAVQEAVKILEKGITADDHQRLANDLLAELASRPGARAGSASTGGAS